MSGGFINSQKEGEHQIVTFTFFGPMDTKKVKEWNDALAKLKKRFKANLVGITVRGDPTPPEYMHRPKPKKKKRG